MFSHLLPEKTVSLPTAPRFCWVHFGEIWLKGGRRPEFEHRLADNIKRVLKPLGLKRVVKDPSRFVLEFEEATPWEKITPRLQKLFGIVNFSPAYFTALSLEALKADLEKTLPGRTFQSFGIKARRSNKDFEKNSHEIEVVLGNQIRSLTGAKVDLENPECRILIKVEREGIYYSFDKYEGAGGLPTAISGKVVSLLSGGIDSPVAAYQMMRRGCRAIFVHFHSVPFTDPASVAKVRDLVKILTEYQMDSKLYLVPLGELQQRIVALAPEEFRVILYRRVMLRLASLVAQKEGALGLVTGESLGQVASQTLPNLATIEAGVALPVFRPLIGLDKVEIIAWARRIGSYETSIRPYPDCCQFMLPHSPSVKAPLDRVEAIEKELSLEEGLEKCLAETSIENCSLEKGFSSSAGGMKEGIDQPSQDPRKDDQERLGDFLHLPEDEKA